MQLLVNSRGRGTSGMVVREEHDFRNIRVQSVTQLRSARREQDPPHFFRGAKQWSNERTITQRTLRLAGLGAVSRGSKRPTAMQALPEFRTHLQ